VDNNPNFAFRLVTEFESSAINTANSNYVGVTSTYATSGTFRFDMVSVTGGLISATPAGPALLSATAFSPSQFQFTVTGTAGSNYIIQAATDLSTSNWISLKTNSSPFTFTDTNSPNSPTRFYRALVGP
jgi:hypothetical protein